MMDYGYYSTIWADIKYHGIPVNCRVCELLGICRDPQNKWRLRSPYGCMLRKDFPAEEYERLMRI